jgi:transketolase C-terminal domain/subunit
VALVSTGAVLRSALAAADELARQGVAVPVYSCPVLARDFAPRYGPLWRHRRLIAVEEHGEAGGFGSYLKEMAPPGVEIRLRGIPERNSGLVGSQAYHWREAGLDPAALVALVRQMAAEA